MHDVEKWPNVLQKSCGVNTTRFLNYVWTFFNIKHRKFKHGILFLTCNIKFSNEYLWYRAWFTPHLFNLAMHFYPWFRNLQNSLESTYARASFLVKLQALDIFVFSFRYFLLKAQPLKLDRHVKILLLRGLVDCRDVCSRK